MVMALPAELLARVATLLTWRETQNMALVSVTWRSAVLAASCACFEWRTTEISAENDENLSESDGNDSFSMGKHAVERLGGNFKGWADVPFAPSLVVISACSNRPRIFANGSLWTRFVEAIEGARLLPPGCLVIGTLCVIREFDEREVDDRGEIQEESKLEVTVALLPETRLEVDKFERKELRQLAKGYELESPLAKSVSGDDGFFVLSINPRSADELAEAVGSWVRGVVPSPAVVGGVLPDGDISSPLMMYWTREQSDNSVSIHKGSTKDSRRVKGNAHSSRGRKQRQVFYPRNQRRAPPTPIKAEEPKIKVEFPTNVVVRFRSKRVRLRGWVSSGVAPVSGIVRSCSSRSSNYAIAYDQVELVDAAQSRQIWSMCELLGAKLDVTIDHAIWIATSDSRDKLERFLSSPSCLSSSEVQLISCTFSPVENAVFSLDLVRWEMGAYGVVLARGDEALRVQRAQEAIDEAFHTCKAMNETPFGLLRVLPRSLGALGVEIPTHSLVTNLAVGPIALDENLKAKQVSKVQQYACSGLLFSHTREKAFNKGR